MQDGIENYINKKQCVPYLAALSIALYFPLLVLISALWMLLGNSMNAALIYVTAILDLAILYFFLPRNKRIQNILLVIVFDVALVWISATIAGTIYDSSYDGQWYHQETLIRLDDGWNPYEKHYSLPQTDATFFATHYPQADAISLYAIWQLFPGNIEDAKGLNFILSIIAFILLRQALFLFFFSPARRGKNLINAVALLAVLNPVYIYQVFTFYVDARLYDSLLICLAFLIIYHLKPNRLHLFFLAVNIVYLINEKFTGLLYAGLIAAGYSAYLIVTKNGTQILKLIIPAAVTIIISLLVVGYSSYVKNYVYFRHPLYPTLGPGNITNAMMQTLAPKNYLDKNTLQKFYCSNLAMPVWSRNPDTSQQRSWFDITAITHYNAYYTSGTEISGFGIYFAEIVLLLVPAVILLIFQRKSLAVILIFYALFFISIWVNSMSFIARYSPHTWLIAVIPILGLLTLDEKWAHRYAWLTITLCFLNDVGILSAQLSVWKQNEKIASQIIELKKLQPVIVYSNWSSIPERLKEQHVQFSLTSSKDSSQKWNDIAFSYGTAFWRK